jgi:hypothetical protein
MSLALGILVAAANAVIHFRRGCGGSVRRPGIYSVPRSGKPILLLGTPRFALYGMWGG